MKGKDFCIAVNATPDLTLNGSQWSFSAPDPLQVSWTISILLYIGRTSRVIVGIMKK